MPKETKKPMTKCIVARPILAKEFSSTSQVDLIDMQSMPSGSNRKWILVFQDHLTKFCIFRALTSKTKTSRGHFSSIAHIIFSSVAPLFSKAMSHEFTSQAIIEPKEV
ncbi:KRAB-A domain-containing protein 2 [Plakobranchus ocellatus]|uniref:KRAB-A domain-containing protein 2 n=1 Tax=Plakobranchus ocellatus TaxID=259542 RepID=A0AAV4C9H8_9GAST|nr:KRAB-A domain-containing protein 2 [Plakobranchus ocellatus]